jgi:hypothetical protein
MARSPLIRTGLLLASLALLVFAVGPIQATEESNWGSIKQAVDDYGVAAKRGGLGKGKGGGIGQDTPTTENINDGSLDGEVDLGDAGGKIRLQVKADMELMLDDLIVTLIVPKAALPKGESITMHLYGVHPGYPDGDQILAPHQIRASNLVIDFGPDGLEFRKSCTLMVKLGKKLNDLKLGELDPWHQHGNGRVDQAGITDYFVTETGGIEVKMSVDGFSRYGLKRY